MPLQIQIAQEIAQSKKSHVKNVKISQIKATDDWKQKNLNTKDIEKIQEKTLKRSKKSEHELKIAKHIKKSNKKLQSQKSEPKLDKTKNNTNDKILSRRPRGMRKNPKKKVPNDM